MRDELPEGWTEAPLPELFEINPPKPRQDALLSRTTVTFVPMGAVDAERGMITTPATRPFGEVRKGYTSFAEGDVIMAKITPCFENGKAAIARGLQNGLGFGSSEFHVFRARGAVLAEYLFHYLRQPAFREESANHMTGTAGQARVPANYLRELILPVPPLAEQRRIIARVEALLDQANRVKARLSRVQAILKRFRRAVLGAACSGRLTEEFRTSRKTTSSAPSASSEAEGEFDDLPEGWIRSNLAALAEVVDPQPSHRTPPMSPGGIPYVGIGDFTQDGRVNLEQSRRVDPDILQEHHARYSLQLGDFIFGKIGTLGRPMLLPQPFNYVLSANVVLVQPRRHCRPAYLYLFMQSPWVTELLQSSSRATSQAAFGIKRIRNIAVPVPSLKEQDQIVRRTRDFMVLADTVQKRLAAAMARVEELRDAILAKAFSGDLVATEAELARAEGRDYEPTDVLLDRIRKERPSRIAATKGRRAESTKRSRGRRSGALDR